MYRVKRFILDFILLISLFSFSPPLAFGQITNSINISLSTTTLEQGDTLLIAVHNNPNQLTGTFGKDKVNFFHASSSAASSSDWVAIVGIDAKKKPGKYDLQISTNGSQKLTQSIEVKKRDFKVTELAITKEAKKKGYNPKNVITNVVASANPSLEKVMKNISLKNYFTNSFIEPLATTTVVGPFGDIRGNKYAWLQHLGTDLRASMRTPVFSINNGKVILCRNLANYGNTIVVDHGYGIYSLYLHLDKFNVKLGQVVDRGQQIALSGNTGYTTGAHLHFSVKVGNASVDPLKFVETMKSL
jgi:murein DD-endopeptidase MepM/ murein hydrolase activator NlpD